MPVYWDTPSADHHYPHLPADTHGCLKIGLVNNMPDSALQATERQFSALLEAAAQDIPVQLSFYALPEVSRKPAAKAHLRKLYTSLDSLWPQQLDGLIVTGAEPVKPHLADEPYWNSLTRLLNWAGVHTHSTVWSCLAAHAAVLHMDDVARVRSQVKHFGILECANLQHHPLTADLPKSFTIPHSRWNGLPEADLLACGYRVLTRTADAGVDLFVKQQQESLFVFFQGHPEYETDTLLREYRRDVSRFLHHESEVNPPLPRNYFPAKASDALTQLREKAAVERSEALLPDVSKVLSHVHVANSWTSTATSIYRNWLHYLVAEKDSCVPQHAPKSVLPASPVGYPTALEG